MISRTEKRFSRRCSSLSRTSTRSDLRRFVPARSRWPNAFLESSLRAKMDSSIKCLTTWETVLTLRRWRTLARRSRWRIRSRWLRTDFWGTRRREELTLCFSRKRLEIWMSWNDVPNRSMPGLNQWAWTQTPYRITRSRWLCRSRIRGARLRMIKRNMMIWLRPSIAKTRILSACWKSWQRKILEQFTETLSNQKWSIKNFTARNITSYPSATESLSLPSSIKLTKPKRKIWP